MIARNNIANEIASLEKYIEREEARLQRALDDVSKLSGEISQLKTLVSEYRMILDATEELDVAAAVPRAITATIGSS